MSDKISFLVDPSAFVFGKRLDAFLRMFRIIKEELNSTDISIVVPSAIHDGLNAIRNEKPLPTNFVDLLGQWWFQGGERYATKETSSSVYRASAVRFLETCKPISASEVGIGSETIGSQSITLSEAVHKLGDVLGRAMHEMLGVSYRLKAQLISFGDRAVNLMKRLGSFVVTMPSEFKKKIKSRGEVRRFDLRIIIFMIRGMVSYEVMKAVYPLLSAEPALQVVIGALALVFTVYGGDLIESAFDKGLVIVLDG